MVGKELNDQLDAYITKLRTEKSTTEPVKFVSAQHTRAVELNHEEKQILQHATRNVYIIKKPKSFIQRLTENFSGATADQEEFELHRSRSQAPKEQEFEQEYQELIEEEKESKSFWHRFTQFFRGIEIVKEEYHDIDREEVMQEQQHDEFYKDYQELSNENTKTGYFARMKTFFFGPKELPSGAIESELHEQSLNQEVEEKQKHIVQLQQDMKNLAVIATKTIKLLPEEELIQFKKSKDFDSFKSILLKHNLIKVKHEDQTP